MYASPTLTALKGVTAMDGASAFSFETDNVADSRGASSVEYVAQLQGNGFKTHVLSAMTAGQFIQSTPIFRRGRMTLTRHGCRFRPGKAIQTLSGH